MYVRNVREKPNDKSSNKNITATPSSAPTYAEIVKGTKTKDTKQTPKTNKQSSLNIINPDR